MQPKGLSAREATRMVAKLKLDDPVVCDRLRLSSTADPLKGFFLGYLNRKP